MSFSKYCDEVKERFTYKSERLICSLTGVNNAGEMDIVLPTHIGSWYPSRVADNAFKNHTSLRSVVVPEGYKHIGENAFYGCSNLTLVDLPNSIDDNIGNNAFAGCKSIRCIFVPNGKQEIFVKSKLPDNLKRLVRVKDVKDGTTGLSYAQAKDGTYVLLYGYGTEEVDVVIPVSFNYKRVSMIWAEAFAKCKSLKSVQIPSTITKIGGWAFSECENLRKIYIPAGVTEIGEWAFSFCEGLREIKVDKKNKRYYSKDNCLIDKKAKKLIAGCSSSKIPKGIKSIGVSAFSGCSGLEEIIVPLKTTSIGDAAFAFCTNLERIIIPETVTSIGKDVFAGCGKLETVWASSKATADLVRNAAGKDFSATILPTRKKNMEF